MHQLNIPLQPEVECGGLGLHVVLSLVAVPRAAAGEEAAAWRGFAPLPSRISVMPSRCSPGAAAQRLCPDTSLTEGDEHMLPAFEVSVFVKSSGTLGDGECLAGCRCNGCFCCSVPSSPLARAAGMPAVCWAVSRRLQPLCTNLLGFPPFVWEHEKCSWQCCCQGLRSAQLQVLAAYLLHLSWALKRSLSVLLYSLSSSAAYLVAIRLDECGGAEQILPLWTR